MQHFFLCMSSTHPYCSRDFCMWVQHKKVVCYNMVKHRWQSLCEKRSHAQCCKYVHPLHNSINGAADYHCQRGCHTLYDEGLQEEASHRPTSLYESFSTGQLLPLEEAVLPTDLASWPVVEVHLASDAMLGLQSYRCSIVQTIEDGLC